jgi:hypothetical protein
MLNSIDQCRYLKENGHRCTEPVRDPLADVLLCKKHTVPATRFFLDVAERVSPGGRSHQEQQEVDRAMQLASAQYLQDEVVYYVQFRDLIKIGTTRNMRSRMGSVPNERVMATEPGGRSLEQRRHLEFKHCRVQGEWFKGDDEKLLAHIESLQLGYQKRANK